MVNFWHILRLRRFAASLWMTILGAALLAACGGQTYSCGTGTANHCYGTVAWSGSPTGFSMELTPVSLSSGDIFIDDEGWLIDYGPSPGSPMSWVEAGIENVNALYYGSTGTTNYFWAYGLNYGSPAGVFMEYPLGSVSPSDISRGSWIAFQINQHPKKAATYDVTISEAASGTPLYTESCASCSMTPNTILEGQELAGSSNAQAPLAFFSYNSSITGSTASIQSSDGTVTAAHPPNAGWFPGNKPSQTSDGGMFFTDCC